MSRSPSSPGLSRHPRLYATEREFDGLNRRCRTSDVLSSVSEKLHVTAAAAAPAKRIDYDETVHNAHLTRARKLQEQVVALLLEWKRTREAKLKRAVLDYVRQMSEWEYWSWIAMRAGDPQPEAIYDLSYGENSATLAIVYDWLHDDLSGAEADLIVSQAVDRSFCSFLHATGRPEKPHWFGHPKTNWNTVCSGGAGMLALALYDVVDVAPEVLARVEQSIIPYMHALAELDGGWEEGIWYWLYGNQYAYLYLLSWEHAMRQAHPLMEVRSSQSTFEFPLDFCPHGIACSFGDQNRFIVMPWQFAALQRFGRADLLSAYRTLFHRLRARSLPQPLFPEFLLFYPDEDESRTGLGAETGDDCEPDGRAARGPSRPVRSQARRIYAGLGWGILADVMPDPSLYVSVRGGTTEVVHGHLDLMSYNCVVNGEQIITNIGMNDYLDTTFGPRRFELPEASYHTKNTILINGVGITKPAVVGLEERSVAGYSALYLDAAEAMGEMYDGRAARVCGRLFVMLENAAVMVLDRISTAHFSVIETRVHTRLPVKPADPSFPHAVYIDGAASRAAVSFAATSHSELRIQDQISTLPRHAATVLRYTTAGMPTDVVFVTLIVPGNAPGAAECKLSESCCVARVTLPDSRHEFVLRPDNLVEK